MKEKFIIEQNSSAESTLLPASFENCTEYTINYDISGRRGSVYVGEHGEKIRTNSFDIYLARGNGLQIKIKISQPNV